MTVKGLTTPYRVGCEDLFVCVGARDSCVASYWIDTLVLKLREILMLLREATSEIYGPRVYSHHINLPSLYYCFAFLL